MEKNKSDLKKYSIMVLLFVISIMTLGVSLSYAYFTINFSGESSVPTETAANLNVTSTIDEADAIDTAELSLIDEKDFREKGEKVTFTVTNNNTQTPSKEDPEVMNPPSNVNAKYIVKIVDMSISKNLGSQYFKWALVINPGEGEKVITGNFADPNICPEEPCKIVDENGNYTKPTNNEDTISGLTKELLTEENAQILEVGNTDNIEFYIWLQNDGNINFSDLSLSEGKDQLYLTNGSFSGKLSIEAFPTRETKKE